VFRALCSGEAEYEEDRRTRWVATIPYRAPEVILEKGAYHKSLGKDTKNLRGKWTVDRTSRIERMSLHTAVSRVMPSKVSCRPHAVSVPCRADMFSVGCIMIEILKGTMLFPNDENMRVSGGEGSGS
jgi:serine/threonine protein kinase